MRSMISGSMAALRRVVEPRARTAVSSTCSVAPTLGYGSRTSAACRPRGAVSRRPSRRFSICAPNSRSTSRW